MPHFAAPSISAEHTGCTKFWLHTQIYSNTNIYEYIIDIGICSSVDGLVVFAGTLFVLHSFAVVVIIFDSYCVLAASYFRFSLYR